MLEISDMTLAVIFALLLEMYELYEKSRECCELKVRETRDVDVTNLHDNLALNTKEVIIRAREASPKISELLLIEKHGMLNERMRGTEQRH